MFSLCWHRSTNIFWLWLHICFQSFIQSILYFHRPYFYFFVWCLECLWLPFDLFKELYVLIFDVRSCDAIAWLTLWDLRSTEKSLGLDFLDFCVKIKIDLLSENQKLCVFSFRPQTLNILQNLHNNLYLTDSNYTKILSRNIK